jgi:hypothetical protein
MDDFLLALRIAAPRAEVELVARGHQSWWRRLGSYFTWVSPMRAVEVALVAVVAVVALVGPRGQQVSGTAELSLTAMRDGAQDGVATTAAGQRLDLKLDLTGISPEALYVVEIADERGNLLWTKQAEPRRGVIHVRTEIAFRRGDHWVRIYRPRDREILREFAVRVR